MLLKISLISLLLLLAACGVQTPSLSNPSFASANFIHTGLETSCANCHAGQRPVTSAGWFSTSFNPAVTPFDFGTHGSPMDCIECHSVGMSMAPARTSADWANGNFHVSLGLSAGNQTLTSCASCHSVQTLAAAQTFVANYNTGNTTAISDYVGAYGLTTATAPATIGHTSGGECITCHNQVAGTGSFAVLADWMNGGPNTFQPGAYVTGKLSTTYPSYLQYTPTLSGSGNNMPTAISTQTVNFPIIMNHQAAAMTGTVIATCTNCHANNNFTAGVFHANIVAAGGTQPTSSCSDCHSASDPLLASGNMPMGATGAASFSGALPSTTPSLFAYGSMPQMTHQNTMITTTFNSLTGATNSSPDCSACHTATNTGSFTVWSGAVFHANLSSQPTTCNVCHGNNRITIANQTQATFAAGAVQPATFAAGTTTFNLTATTGHGGSAQCVLCHATPAGATDSLTSVVGWQTNGFSHSANAPTTCVNCHSYPVGSIVPTAGGSFNHSGTAADCNTCHAAINLSGTLNMASWVGGTATPVGGVANPSQSFTYSSAYNPTYVYAATGATAVLAKSTAAVSGAQVAGYMNHAGITLACTTCHAGYTTAFQTYYHANIGSAVTTCNSCHLNGGTTTTQPGVPLPYTLGATTTNSYVTGPAASYTLNTTPNMSHEFYYTALAGTTISGGTVTGSPNDCSTCHTGVLSATGTYAVTTAGGHTPTPTVWATGNLHSHVSGIVNCSGCHIMRMPASDLQNTLTYSSTSNVACSPTLAGPLTACSGSSGQIPYVGNISYTLSATTAASGQTIVQHFNHLSPVFQEQNQAVSTATTPVQTMDCYTCHGNTGAGTANGWASGNFHTSLKSKGYTQPTQCITCHAGDMPSAAQVTATAGGYVHTSGTGECLSCHTTSISNFVSGAALVWSGATSGPHPASGSTAGSTLVCQSCHGGAATGNSPLLKNCSSPNSGAGPCSLAYSDTQKAAGSTNVSGKNMNGNWGTTATSGGNTVYANHFWDGSAPPTTGSACISCHVDFTSFNTNQASTGVVSLQYGHAASTNPVTLGATTYSGGYCTNCHYMDASGKYTAMSNYFAGATPYMYFGSSATSTPTYGTAATTTTPYFFAAMSTTGVSGNVNGSLSGVTHVACTTCSKQTSLDCSNCHSYKAHTTTTGTAEWKTSHTAKIWGVSSSKQHTNGCANCH